MHQTNAKPEKSICGDSLYEIFGEPISVYTRAQGLEDAALLDVSETAREAGITFPVAITAALQADISNIPEDHSYQSYAGRLWDVLWMMTCAVRGLIPSRGDDREMVYDFIMHVGEAEEYSVQAVCGPGDEGEPVLTLMRPEED